MAAALLVSNKQISMPNFDEKSASFTFTCYSSLALEQEQSPTTYQISISQTRTSCTCPDFRNRGGACKHIRAAVAQAEILRTMRSIDMPSLRPWIPSTKEEAYRLAHIQGSIPSHDGNEECRAQVDLATGTTASLELDLNPIEHASLTVADIVRESSGFVSRTSANTTHPKDALELDSSDVPIDVESGFSSGVESGYTTGAESGTEDVANIPSIPTDSDRPTRDAFSELERTNREALNEQTIARVFFDLETSVPKFDHLASLLRDVDAYLDQGSEYDIERARRIDAALDNLGGQFKRMLREVTSGNNSQTIPSSRSRSITPPLPSFRTRSTQKRTYEILAPPVERRAQKRKESYNVH